MRRGGQSRIPEDLSSDRVRNHNCFGSCRERTGCAGNGLPEEIQNHDGQVPPAPFSGGPSVCAHPAVLGRGRGQRLVLRRLHVRGRAYDLHGEFIQQRPHPRLHQPGPLPRRGARHEQPRSEETSGQSHHLRGRVAPRRAPHRSRPSVRQSGEQLYPYFLRAHLPTGFFHNLGGRFPLPAHPSGLRAARARDSHLLLHHHLQAVTRLQGHAEAQGAQDHRGSDRVLLRLLVAVLRRDPAGHADAAGGDSPQLRARAGSTEVDLRDGGSRVLSLLPQPNPLRVSGGEVQEVRSQRSISQPGLQSEDSAEEESRDVIRIHRIRVF